MGYRIYWPPLTRAFKIWALLLFGLWFATIAWNPLQGLVAEHLLASREAVFGHARLWTLLTYALWHFDFGHLFFNLLALYLFGAEVRQHWPPGRFWRYLTLCALGGSLAAVLAQWAMGVSVPLLGASPVVMGLVGAYCWMHWRLTLNFFVFQMQGRTLLALFVGLDVVLALSGGQTPSLVAHLGGLATGMLLLTGLWHPARLRQILGRWRARRHLRVVQGQATRAATPRRERPN